MTKKPPRVLMSPLTGKAYLVTDYIVGKSGRIIATSKTDVTADVVEDLMALAWARGWNECNAAEPGVKPRNPYRTSKEQA